MPDFFPPEEAFPVDSLVHLRICEVMLPQHSSGEKG
jgi:hypothetical protein